MARSSIDLEMGRWQRRPLAQLSRLQKANPPKQHSSAAKGLFQLKPFRTDSTNQDRAALIARNAPARLIAFYSPDFTARKAEGVPPTWRKVEEARPQFVGHAQPRKPDPSIGFYSEVRPEVLQAQSALAKLHGVHGFCIYIRSPLELAREHPLEVLLANNDIDLSFCVCLGSPAGGSDDDRVRGEEWLGRSISRSLAKYMGDPRYLRIGNRPILVVAQPDLLGDSQPTATQLRQWAGKKGIGELHLSCLASPASQATDDFDAVIDFAPDPARAVEITKSYPGLSKDFRGRICDWRQLSEEDDKQSAEGCPTRFLCVSPGWDNSPQAGKNATVYVGNSPQLFQLWADRAISTTASLHRNQSERLLFVNAWNDWLNGAVIEPEEQAGSTNLLALRNAVFRQSARMRVAVAIHAFYPEILPEILRRVEFMPPDTKLFVSCRPEDTEAVQLQLEGAGREFQMYRVANRGRDVAPFLEMLADIDAQGFSLVAKIHTKRSPHFEGGEEWRAELFDAVLGLGAFSEALGAFIDDPALGMVGPTQHFLPMRTYLEGNEDHIFPNAARLGMSKEDALARGFFAGTMFIARVAAIRGILSLGLRLEDFEPEAGQTNGTLAHGLERLFSICVNASGFRHGGHWAPGSEMRVNSGHQFVLESDGLVTPASVKNH